MVISKRKEAKSIPEEAVAQTLATEDCSTTVSSAEIMTPSNTWSDVGSDIPLISDRHDVAGPTTKKDRKQCEFAVACALESLGIAQVATSSSESVGSHGRLLLHKACEMLIEETRTNPPNKTASTDVTGASEVSETNKTVESQKIKQDPKTLDDIIEAMSREISDLDIATLVFHLTILNRFEKYERVEVREPSSDTDTSPADSSSQAQTVSSEESEIKMKDVVLGFLGLLICYYIVSIICVN